MILRLFRRTANRDLIDRLRGEIVAASRHPVLFTEYGIEDSLDGRFESLTLHAVLALRRLSRMEPPAPEIAQDLADAIFHSLDIGLREKGVGDISVPRHMKTFARAFFGRAEAYDRALQAGSRALEAALARNVYGGRGDSSRLARYVLSADRALAHASLDMFAAGKIPFPEPSAIL